MPIPPPLQRKLQQALGTEAGDSLVTYLDSIEAMRGDIAELGHALQRLDAELRTLIKATEDKLTGHIAASEARTAAAIEKGLKEQTRFFFLAWSVILAFVVGLYTR